MNWQFRLRNRPLPPQTGADNCVHVRSLLSLMSDGMASAKEAREAQAHLLTCADCRQAHLWIEATRQVIAARPVVLPPPDMRARIALAIAASAETAVPAVPIAMPPARRAFRLRPAYAAAASVAIAGAFLGHYLLVGGHAPDSVAPMPPLHAGSAGQGQIASAPAPGHGKSGSAPARVPHKQPLTVATLPQGTSAPATIAHGGAARQAAPGDPLRSPQAAQGANSGVVLTAKLPQRSLPLGPEIKSGTTQVALVPRHSIVPAPAHMQPRTDHMQPRTEIVASLPIPKLPVRIGSQNPKMAALPKLPVNVHAAPSPVVVPASPLPVSNPAPATVVARLPDAPPASARAVPGDALGSFRTSLASYHSEGYAHRLFMASGVHQRQNYTLLPIVYTPTSLSETSPTRRTTATISHPVSVQASPASSPLASESALTSSDQRRSERDKQWSDASANGGA